MADEDMGLYNKVYAVQGFTGSPEHTKLHDKQLSTIRGLLIFTAVLSTIGALSVILVTFVRRKIRHSRVLPVFHLSSVDFIAAILLVVNSALFLSDDSHLESMWGTCSILSGLLMSLYFTSLMLTVSYALDAYVRTKSLINFPSRFNFSGSFEMQTSCTPWYIPLSNLLAWIVPFLIMTTCIIVEIDYQESNPINANCTDTTYSCLLIYHHPDDPCMPPDYHSSSVKSVVIGLVTFAALAISILYIRTYRVFRRGQFSQGLMGHRQNLEALQLRNRGLTYILMFVICWVPAYILAMLTLSRRANVQKLYWLYIIAALTMPLQGLVNSLGYGWCRKGFLRALDLENLPSVWPRFRGRGLSRENSSTVARTGSGTRSSRDYRTFSNSGYSSSEPNDRLPWREQTTTNHSSSVYFD